MKVIANHRIMQTVGSLQIERTVGSQFELNDTEATSAIAAGHVRAAPVSVTPNRPTNTKVVTKLETK